jgi:arginine-tRNA-protein transferase
MLMDETTFMFESEERCTLSTRHQLPNGTTTYIEIFNEKADRKVDVDGAYADAYLEQGSTPLGGGYSHLSCRSCNICLPIRVVLPLFKLRSEHRRVLSHNRRLRLEVHEGPPPNMPEDNEFTRLLHDYTNARFADAGWATVNLKDASGRLQMYETLPGLKPMHLTLRDEFGRLAGCNVFHTGNICTYDASFFYDPALLRTGIGHALTLMTIDHLRQAGFIYMHLGYYTRTPTPLSWKDKFFPLEVRVDGVWQRHDSKLTLRKLRADPAQAYPAPSV